MGCCESSEAKQARKLASHLLSARQLITDVFNNKAEENPPVFFACMSLAIKEALNLNDDDTNTFLKKATSESKEAEQKYDAYLHLLGSNQAPKPIKTRAKMMQVWLRFDKDHSGDLDPDEVKAIIVAMNLPDLLAKKLQEKSKEIKTNIKFHEFQKLYFSLVDWEELDFIWTAVAGDFKATSIDLKTFQRFLKESQSEQLDDRTVENLMVSYGCGPHNEMSKEQFFNYLTDTDVNTPYQKQVHEIYQNMDQPLPQYFINSSHNTYLSAHQLYGESKCSCYTKALLDGCRCVELDCWDGDNNEPIITHGYTQTTSIKFLDVIKAIHESAFVTSEYPVILSLEVHTSLKQQEVMAQMMIETFGSNLAMPTWQSGEIPKDPVTPSFYMRKILVKGKRLPAAKGAVESDSESEKEESSEAKKMKEEQKLKEKQAQKKGGEASSEKKDEKKKAGGHGHKIAQELSDTIIIEAKGVGKFADAIANARAYQCSSFTESKSEDFCKHNLQDYITHNTVKISRIYPAGTRIDSSNYPPQNHWYSGCQIVALNWQSSETYELRLNKGKFIDNGNCGYVLKPQYLREPTNEKAKQQHEAESRTLSIEIISGFCLPKPSNASKGEVVDPYVKCFVEGPMSDPSKTKSTHVINDNGFHPVWRGGGGKENMEFWVKGEKEMNIFVIQVWDRDDLDSDDFLAEGFIPLHQLKCGIRAIPLWDVESHLLTGAHVIAKVEWS